MIVFTLHGLTDVRRCHYPNDRAFYRAILSLKQGK